MESVEIIPLKEKGNKNKWRVTYPHRRHRDFEKIKEAKEWANSHLNIYGRWVRREESYKDEEGRTRFRYTGSYHPHYVGSTEDKGEDPPERMKVGNRYV